MPRKKHFDEEKPDDDIKNDDVDGEADDLTPESYDDPDSTGGVPEDYGNPDVNAKTTRGEVERTKDTIDLGARQLDKAPAGDSEGKEATLAPHATHTDLPRIPTQADFWLGGQGKAQQESLRRDEEERREREELKRIRRPTGKALREQEAGEKRLVDYQSGGKGAREAEVGKEALKSYENRLPDEDESKAGKQAQKAYEDRTAPT